MKFWEFCVEHKVTEDERRKLWRHLGLWRLYKMMEHDPV